MEGEMTAPFLSVVTRCCCRPKMLAVNIRSVLAQTDRDIEQVYIVDGKRRGLAWANQQVPRAAHRVDGDYVYILDDDTKLVAPAFVAKLRDAVRRHKSPGVVMVKSRRPQFPPRLLPKADAWGEVGKLRLGATNCLCYVVRADLWKEEIRHWATRAAADWSFLKALLKYKSEFAWLDLVAAETQQVAWLVGRPKSFEKCGGDWWKRTVKQFGIVHRGGDDWRLPLWEKTK
jgi:hypothetical protein